MAVAENSLAAAACHEQPERSSIARLKHARMMMKPKCHTAVAQRMPVIECLSSEWTQGLPRVVMLSGIAKGIDYRYAYWRRSSQ
ncbi:MAG: hypothetical protein AAFY56_16365 [Pseudomonadota bacterium]